MNKKSVVTFLLASTLVVGMSFSQMGGTQAQTPTPMVDSYSSLADILIAAKKTEWNLVHGILAGTYSHAQGTMSAAQATLKAGGNASEAVEKLATLVSQLGTEGDAAVGAVRKRLLEAGHHHHAAPGEEEKYDPGYVIVTREAKKVFLAASQAIAKMSASPDAAALESEWKKVQKQFMALHPDSGH